MFQSLRLDLAQSRHQRQRLMHVRGHVRAPRPHTSIAEVQLSHGFLSGRTHHQGQVLRKHLIVPPPLPLQPAIDRAMRLTLATEPPGRGIDRPLAHVVCLFIVVVDVEHLVTADNVLELGQMSQDRR